MKGGLKPREGWAKTPCIDGSQAGIYNNLYQRAELDYLIYNDPAAYVELIMEGDPKKYLKAVTQYRKL